MPHIIVKLYTGRSKEQLKKLADAIAKTVVEIAGCKESAVSVAVEEYEPQAWPQAVYKPDIVDRADTLVIKPGYNPFE